MTLPPSPAGVRRTPYQAFDGCESVQSSRYSAAPAATTALSATAEALLGGAGDLAALEVVDEVGVERRHGERSPVAAQRLGGADAGSDGLARGDGRGLGEPAVAHEPEELGDEQRVGAAVAGLLAASGTMNVSSAGAAPWCRRFQSRTSDPETSPKFSMRPSVPMTV